MFFTKHPSEPLSPSAEALNEYERLVDWGDSSNFLDVDTTFVIECRDAIEDFLNQNEYDDRQILKLKRIDEKFKNKSADCIDRYRDRISKGENAKYLNMVLRSIEYPDAHNPASGGSI